jgi:hypothetical protein
LSIDFEKAINQPGQFLRAYHPFKGGEDGTPETKSHYVMVADINEEASSRSEHAGKTENLLVRRSRESGNPEERIAGG